MNGECAPTRLLRTGIDAKKRPVRTCVGCRGVTPSSRLVRLRINSLGQVVNASQSAAGRGAWIHPDPECIRAALRRRAFNRAFRREVQVDAQGLAKQVGSDR